MQTQRLLFLLHGTRFINVIVCIIILCEILLGYQLGWNIEYLEYLNIYMYILWSKIVSNKCHIWMVMFIVQFKPKSTLKSIKIYKCKLWHLLWEILAKTYYEIVQFCMIHRSIYDFIYSERYSLRYHIFYYSMGIDW